MQSLRRKALPLIWLVLMFALSVAAGGWAHATKYYAVPDSEECSKGESDWEPVPADNPLYSTIDEHDGDTTRDGIQLDTSDRYDAYAAFNLSGSSTTQCGLVQLKSWWGKSGYNSTGYFDVWFRDWTGSKRHQLSSPIGSYGPMNWEAVDGGPYEFVNSGDYQTTPPSWSAYEAAHPAWDPDPDVPSPICVRGSNPDGVGLLRCDEVFLKFSTFDDQGWTPTTEPDTFKFIYPSSDISATWSAHGASPNHECVDDRDVDQDEGYPIIGNTDYYVYTSASDKTDVYGTSTDASSTGYTHAQLIAVVMATTEDDATTFTASYLTPMGWEWTDLKVIKPTTSWVVYRGPIVHCSWNPVTDPIEEIKIESHVGSGELRCDDIYIRVW